MHAEESPVTEQSCMSGKVELILSSNDKIHFVASTNK